MTAVRPVPVAGGDEKGRRFRLLPTDRSPDELEKEMLSLWKEEKLFHQTLAQGEGKPEFVFFEGPPTANGRPGIHHVFSRTVKDLFCRYRAMSVINPSYFLPICAPQTLSSSHHLSLLV